MREILFRGKTPSGKWVEGFFLIRKLRHKGDKTFMSEKTVITTGITELLGAYGEREETIENEVLPETVGQYTGLTDKNGKKIFDKDIVNLFLADGVEVGVIGWSDIDVRYKFASPDGTAYGVDCTCVFEIIGNIYDNPELLGEHTNDY